MAKEWVVYAKPPSAGARKLLGCLGRYVKRVAISHDRIQRLRNGQVHFTYRDYADGSRQQSMQLSAPEFLRRFVQHILPGGFCKVRYYGILATRNRKTKLRRCHRLLGSVLRRAAVRDWQVVLLELTGKDPTACSQCGGTTVVVEWLRPQRAPPGRIPPDLLSTPNNKSGLCAA